MISLSSDRQIALQTTPDDLSKTGNLLRSILTRDNDDEGSNERNSIDKAAEHTEKSPTIEDGRPDDDQIMDLTRQTGDFSIYFFYAKTLAAILWAIF